MLIWDGCLNSRNIRKGVDESQPTHPEDDRLQMRIKMTIRYIIGLRHGDAGKEVSREEFDRYIKENFNDSVENYEKEILECYNQDKNENYLECLETGCSIEIIGG